ncbi:probable RNA polymerase II nuclear localization protein SLC7A6OS [Trichogramma pretiosum]|uniref:probable RNA polymerase II nuclear localization protein SLC7A6OS n=1 Tax=Trichogramma pretiosum TaxID=7493 RepID=UPI000C71985D|nr:probable RNA polymerase II nuclear localization protein SLC7A6OS [Trichogramma pretiosum]
MASVIRVKRKRGEEKLDALKILCKKRRTNGEEAAALETETAIFTFAGTVEDKHDDVVVNRIQSTKEELQSQYKKHTVDIVKKVKEQTKQKSCQNRYKVVNSLRQLDKTGDEESEFNIVDMEDVNAHSDDSNVNYEYDLYYINNADLVIDDSTTVLEEVTYNYEETYRNEENDYDSDDSNSETNAKNDYGDSDNAVNDSDEEEGLEKIIKSLHIKSNSDSSSSDEDLIYGLDDYSDKYAKYGCSGVKSKKKSIKISSDNSDSTDDSEEELSDFEYFDDDDDDDKDDLLDYY